jgi:dTDP-4-dehydrorhamnose 3,5-epimerase
VIRGAVYDVAVDIRLGSPTYGQWAAATLTAEVGEQIWVPRGFAHAYCTITDDAEIFYKVDGQYAPQAEGGIIWNDPDLAIPWPLDGEPELSGKDKLLPRLKDLGPVEF